MLPTKLKVPVLLAAMAVLATGAAAQQPTGNLYNVTHVVIKADHVATYRDYLKKMSDGYKKAGVKSYHVYVGMSGNPLEYVIVRPVASYGDLDSPNPLNKVYSEAERARMNAQRDQCTESVRVMYERGVAAAGTGEPKAYRIVTRFRVKPGMNATYTSAIKDELAPAIAKVNGLRWRVRRVEWGGSRSEFVTIHDLDKLAELDKPSPATQAFGAEGAAKWAKRMSDWGTQVEALVYRHIAELGFTAAP